MAEVAGTDPGLGISGNAARIAGSTAGAIGMVTRIGLAGFDVNKDIDITTMNTGGWMLFIAGLKDAKEASLDLIYQPLNTSIVFAALGVSQTWTITLPDGATFVATGYLKHLGTTVPDDDKIAQTVTIRFSGTPVFHQPS